VPGGRIDPGEEPLAAALREAEEEIGLSRRDADVLGRLSETLVLQTAFRLTPWVASVPYPYPWIAEPGEVDEILHVPLSALERPGVHRVEPREAYGMNLDVHYFTLGADVLWGATARIVWELLGVWRTL
jgi:8-oxo-dGTP pyrophosphatase MutT (NUDIX family)